MKTAAAFVCVGETCSLPISDANVAIMFKRTYADLNLFTRTQHEYDEMHRRVIVRRRVDWYGKRRVGNDLK